MGKIIFVKTLDNKPSPALNFLMKLWDNAELSPNDTDYIPVDLPKLIQQGLELIEIAEDYPIGKYEDFFGVLISEDGTEYERQLVKPLGVKPIYEMLINFNSEHFFRAIYFPFILDGEQYYCFTDAFIKTPNVVGSDKTDLYRNQARRIYEAILKNPEILRRQL